MYMYIIYPPPPAPTHTHLEEGESFGSPFANTGSCVSAKVENSTNKLDHE